MGKHLGPQGPIDTTKMQPSEALVALLKHAQEDHKKCVISAQQANMDVAEKCALTWGEVHLRWLQYGAYRAPFKADESEAKYNKYWTRKRIEW
eukprot:CAMPEP_0205830642 /NCGR_PEP_ID=MMETSP0206-20130828/41692_1 /ASSEMBLY_ACC=CAM_ASM_000279 /TAXON_ID=36767 /ORGANISM="Euplotes focardii, Strain TN1" /LENGTH=92 /DNA_ID=CAMNT_0053134495 /DNA_START=19 /DNA_END=294 /DNA_ORIENTATION=+